MVDTAPPRIGIELAFRASQAHRRELIQTLEGIQQRMRETDPTCECVLYEDLHEANRYLWTEWWAGAAECDSKRSTDRFRALLGAVKVLGTPESIRMVQRLPETNPDQNDDRHDRGRTKAPRAGGRR